MDFRFTVLEPGVFRATNLAQGFQARLAQGRLELTPVSPDAAEPRWHLVLRTRSFGRADALIELEEGPVVARDERCELERKALTEWFESREEGLEQGWTIAARPGGAGPLWIGLGLAGELGFWIDEGGRSGRFCDARGEIRLRYIGLHATDAAGRELPARLRPSPDGPGIEVDDARALYPVTVDPLLTSPAWTAQGNQPGCSFGHSVACAGDVNGDGYSDVIVGAPDYTNPSGASAGRAQVFLGSPSGPGPDPSWTVEGNRAGARFGFSVATAGDVDKDGFSDVIIGAPRYTNDDSQEGRAYVYLGSPRGLAPTPAWSVEGNQFDSHFGESVATAGDVNADGYSDVIVGAWNYTFDGVRAGRVFVYHGSPGGLSTTPAWRADGPHADSRFGSSVAPGGDVNGDGFDDVLVGVPAFQTGGIAYGYSGSPTGLVSSSSWASMGSGIYPDAGVSVATAGDVNGDGYSDVLVGASHPSRSELYLGSSTGTSDTGSPLLFEPIASSRSPAVATAGDIDGDGRSEVLYGSPGYGNGQANEGLAAVSFWSPTAGRLGVEFPWGESGQSGALMGFSVAAAGDVNGDGYGDILVGVPSYDGFGQPNEGLAAVYFGHSDTVSNSAAWTASGELSNVRFGSAVSSAGDVNGDGFSDVIVGAPEYDGFQRTDDGLAAVYYGSSLGLEAGVGWTAEGAQSGAQLGNSVAAAGDLNGDGYGDVVVGAPFYDNLQPGEGRAIAYMGSPSGLRIGAAWTAEADVAGAGFGYSVAGAGDVNGDGYADLLIGAHGIGAAFVYLGSASGVSATPAWTAVGSEPGSLFGFSVAGAGDVNGDGYSDVIVGESLFTGTQSREGRACVYFGSRAGPATTPSWTAVSRTSSGFLGSGVAAAGDVNGDGYGDILVRAARFSDGIIAGLVYHGSPTGPGAEPARIVPLYPGATSWSLAAAGDVNGDGHGDVLVGYELQFAGVAFCYLGSAGGLGVENVNPLISGFGSGIRGSAVASAGDVDGNGYSDVLLGLGSSDETGAALFPGNRGRGGWIAGPQQRRQSDAAPIGLLGRADYDGFRVRVGFERSLAGFSWASGAGPAVRLEWEVADRANLFDGGSMESGTPQTSTGMPLTLNELVSGLEPKTPYKWRARLRTNNPLIPTTPWFSMAGNGITENKLRTLGTLTVGRRPR